MENRHTLKKAKSHYTYTREPMTLCTWQPTTNTNNQHCNKIIGLAGIYFNFV